MRIVTPTEIEAVAWQGYLEAPGEVYRSSTPLPRVTLGEPAWWPAEALAAQTGQAWSPPGGEQRYTLVRLACTLHPASARGTAYRDARLTAYLRPAGAGGRAVAHDLYPERLTAEQAGTFSVKLGPDLRFAGVVDASLGELGVEIAFRRAYPVIQAYGLGEPAPYWQFARHASHPLAGSQHVYAVVAAPAAAAGVRLSMELAVTVESRWGPVRFGMAETARAHASRTLAWQEVGPAGRGDAPPVAAVRRLLLACFEPATLRAFCQDRPAFRPILDRFSPADGLAAMVGHVIDHCDRQVLWDELLAGVRGAYPRQWARFEGELGIGE